jgi:putative CocE/NonD family hydrolase
VTYLCVGSGWRTASAWPPPHRVESWTATSGGNANSRHGDGRLVRGDADPGPADVLVVEPLVPYPGDVVDHQDEAAAEDRRDVLCYTSDVLADALDLAGSSVATIVAACDRPSHDLVVTLALVAADGVARALACGARRCGAGCDSAPIEHTIALRPIAWRCPAGTRLRLDVSGARFPAFDRNPHAEIAPARALAEDTVVATISVHALRLDLPIDNGPGVPI